MHDRPGTLAFLGAAFEIETLNADANRVPKRCPIDDVRGYRVCRNLLKWCMTDRVLRSVCLIRERWGAWELRRDGKFEC